MAHAVDLGVTQTKVYANGKLGKFDSLVCRADGEQVPGSMAGMELTLDGDAYYVGEKAAYDGEAANYPVRMQALDSLDDVRFCAALSMLDEEPLHVVTGLPVHEFSKLREKFANHLTRAWSFEVNGVPVRRHVHKVSVVPQGAGAYYASILAPDGSTVNPSRASSKVLVFDIGGRTVNAVTYDKARFVGPGSFTTFHGMVHVYNGLKKRLYRESEVSVSLYEAGKALRDGSIRLGANRLFLRPIIEEAAAPIWREIEDTINLEIPNWRTYNEVLLAGGGGQFFEPYFREFFKGVPVNVIEKPEYANVRGYGFFGALQAANSRSIPSRG